MYILTWVLISYLSMGIVIMFTMDAYKALTGSEAVGVTLLWPAFIIKAVLLILRWIGNALLDALTLLF